MRHLQEQSNQLHARSLRILGGFRLVKFRIQVVHWNNSLSRMADLKCCVNLLPLCRPASSSPLNTCRELHAFSVIS